MDDKQYRELSNKIDDLRDCVKSLEAAFLSYSEIDSHWYLAAEHFIKGSILSCITFFILMIIIL